MSNSVRSRRREGETAAPRCRRVSGSIQTIVVAAALLAAGAVTTASAPAKKSMRPSPAQRSALLQPPAAPDCAFKAPAGLNPGDARLVRLEFEQRCFKAAATAIRSQLILVKRALGRTDKSDAEPDCTLKSVPDNASEKDARLMRLDYEAQCYRQTADIERAALARMQKQLQAPVVRKPAPAASHKTRTASRKRSFRPYNQRNVAERFQAQGR